MDDILSNDIVKGALAAMIAAVVFWLIRKILFLMDENKILEFLKQSRGETGYRFRSTEAIVSATNLEQSRVQAICGNSKKIRRNQAEKESWCVAD